MFESLGPVDNTTLRERVYRTLKQAILEGRFSPGETLPTRSLAEVLGTSVMPVRDALLRLNAEGGVEVLPNRAARLPVLSRESIAELYEVRLNLEGLAATLAAKRITQDELAAVEQAFAGMMQASEQQRYQRLPARQPAVPFQHLPRRPVLSLASNHRGALAQRRTAASPVR